MVGLSRVGPNLVPFTSYAFVCFAAENRLLARLRWAWVQPVWMAIGDKCPIIRFSWRGIRRSFEIPPCLISNGELVVQAIDAGFFLDIGETGVRQQNTSSRSQGSPDAMVPLFQSS